MPVWYEARGIIYRMPDGRPRVSVIIPAYNRAALLPAAIDSVLAQTFSDFEVVIVDDGSTDSTAEVAHAYCARDSRVRFIRRENGGISAAVNTGMRAATGALIARLDSDDKWLPCMLETTVAILDARPDIGFVYGKSQWFSGNDELMPKFTGHAPAFPGDPLRSLLWDDPTSINAALARRECFDRAGFYDESLRSSEDWDMWLRVVCWYDFAFEDRVLALYRAHEGNLTSYQNAAYDRFLTERHQVLDNFFRRADLPPRARAMQATAYRNHYVYQGNILADKGRWRAAFAAFRRALATGDAPAQTLARIVWFTCFVRVMEKTETGRRFLTWQSEWRRSRRSNA